MACKVIQVLLAFAVALTMLPGNIALAQSDLGVYLSGTITCGDTRLAGAVITAESAATGQSVSTISDDQGGYQLALPAQDMYRVRVELPGFSGRIALLSATSQSTLADFRLMSLGVRTYARSRPALLGGPSPRETRMYSDPTTAASPPALQQGPLPEVAVGSTHERSNANPVSADLHVDFSHITGHLADSLAASASAQRVLPLGAETLAPSRPVPLQGPSPDISAGASHQRSDAKPFSADLPTVHLAEPSEASASAARALQLMQAETLAASRPAGLSLHATAASPLSADLPTVHLAEPSEASASAGRALELMQAETLAASRPAPLPGPSPDATAGSTLSADLPTVQIAEPGEASASAARALELLQAETLAASRPAPLPGPSPEASAASTHTGSTHERSAAKPVSADLAMDFSSITGHLPDPVAAAASAGPVLPLAARTLLPTPPAPLHVPSPDASAGSTLSADLVAMDFSSITGQTADPLAALASAGPVLPLVAQALAPSRPPQIQGPLPDATAGSTHDLTHKPSDGAPLSADLPTDFSFVTGHLAESADASDSAGPGHPLHQSRVHGGVSYRAGNSALDASPYALHGIPAAKPQYAQNTFSASLGSTLPSGNKKATTSLFASYNGNRSATPYNGFATVPTSAMRAGDFSGLHVLSQSAAGRAVTIYDPTTGQPFANNRIPLERMSPAALGLLQYIPLPSSDGISQNSRFVTATHSRGDSFGLSLTRSPSADSNKKGSARGNLSASLGYHRSEANLPNAFPGLGGDSRNVGWNANLAYTLTKGFFTNNLSVGFNSTDSHILNHFHNDVASAVGINGVSRDSFDWGLPAISFAQFTGLRDVVPTLRANRNFNLADALSWSRGTHNLKWGGEFKRLALDLRSNDDAAGSFTFTGFGTAQFVNGIPVPGTGYDFADFLLGLPQKTDVQYSNGGFLFNGNAWNLYFLDDWRIAKNVSLNLGLRYEYVSPFSEAHNRLVTLDAPPDFSEVTVVPAGGVGPFSGRFPDTIVAPDRYNFAPRIGVAWRAAERVIVRAGYSVEYDTSAYNSLATRLAVQPPFAVEQTNVAMKGQPLSLTNGFPALQPGAVANDFASARNQPLSYAHIWTLQLQNELPGGFVLVTSYTGTKGVDLQMLRAPNRTATGLLLPRVAPFLWQTDEGSSMLHAGSVSLEKRLASGLSFGASYMFSRSIDNDPALGDDTQVAQNDRALNRDRGLSAFDQRHRLAVNYAYELPFGHGRRWLNRSAIANQLLGDWSFTGTINYASGFPLSPHVVGAFGDVEAGGYGALRPDVTGQPVQLAQPTMDRFFNTGAFTLPPAGQYGNAGRNIITGPWNFSFDASLAKSFTIGERHVLLFRGQATNLLNSPLFAQVDTNLNSLTYGQIIGVGAMRTIQIGVQYSF